MVDKSHFGEASITLAINSLIDGLTQQDDLNAATKHVEDQMWERQTGKWLCEIGPTKVAFGGNVYYKKRFLFLKFDPPDSDIEFKVRIL